MGKHKLPHGGHKIDKAARHARKIARRKLHEGLIKDPRTGRRVRGY